MCYHYLHSAMYILKRYEWIDTYTALVYKRYHH